MYSIDVPTGTEAPPLRCRRGNTRPTAPTSKASLPLRRIRVGTGKSSRGLDGVVKGIVNEPFESY